MDDVISSRSDHFSVLSPTSDFCSSWAPIVAASPLLLRIEEDASKSIAEDRGCLAILKIMESSRAAVVTPTWNVFERMAETRWNILLGLPCLRDLGHTEAKRGWKFHVSALHVDFILPSATGIGIGPDKNRPSTRRWRQTLVCCQVF
jgi:hypothetical protein